MAADQTISVAIVGHSYVRRLKVYAAQQNIPYLRLDTDKFFVSIRGKGGLCLRHLRSDANIVHFVNVPDICFLQIGENDIVPESTRDMEQHISLTLFGGLCSVIGTSEVIAMRRDVADVIEAVEQRVRSSDESMSSMESGSQREGFRLIGSDLDSMKWFNDHR
ncbi:uncharacterized protein LOC134272161, partial [Saccostrea cucullata]|uniref:uncharacterized protein LOC134272161 n=1 Tax=Saccostrea cuccullata TaxID=36930 RepID=UPI002ED5E561